MIRNLKTKELSTKVMIPFIVFAMIVGALNVSTSEASGSRWEYSYRSESFYRAAIYVFWQNDPNLKDVDCNPAEVKFSYFDFQKEGEENALAAADLFGATKTKWLQVNGPDIPAPKLFDEMRKRYCTIRINTRLNRESRTNACITMIHEYGHLLGYVHSRSPNSPMYASYEGLSKIKRADLETRNIKRRLAKSICPGPTWKKI